ncbi:type 4a pilus biogenesis protein PilO [Nitrospina gracilis]|uniref:type 4a pilus biogenesis protein PilO n=1 Tax=Nitrospina gracilis TaxID=35801 RepID=UPI001F43ED50|nr:type 4a pilus biogenesis protein PilO [Nitrospina gracilis]MCF8721864.1 Tfp pilus assembly protein PilO [Nitrospina gracilis Nb-211]
MDKILDKIPYDKLDRFQKPQAIMAGAVLCFGVILMYYFLVYSAYQDEYRDLETKLGKTQDKLKLYQQEVSQKELITKQVATLSGTLVEKKRQLPLVEQLPTLLNKISDVGRFLDVNIVTFRLDEASEKRFYKEIPITMTITGDYYRTAGFFDTLQSLLRMVNISKLKMVRETTQVSVKGKMGEAKREAVLLLKTDIQAKTFAYIEGSEKEGE